jgi:hypothetical protein
MRWLAMTIFVISSLPQPAAAEPITWLFAGEITSTSSSTLAGYFPTSGSFSLALTYDTSAVERQIAWRTDAELGYYVFSPNGLDNDPFTVDWSASFAGHEYHLSQGSEIDGGYRFLEMGVRTGELSGTPAFFFGDTLSEHATVGDVLGDGRVMFYPWAMEATMRWPGADPFGSDGLPAVFPDDPVLGEVHLYLQPCDRNQQTPCTTDGGGGVYASITGIQQVRVPEPGTFLIVAAGVAMRIALRARGKHGPRS